jgi:hypothetical protein
VDNIQTQQAHDPEHSSFMTNFSFGEDSLPSGDGLLWTAVVFDPRGNGEEGGVGMDLEMG